MWKCGNLKRRRREGSGDIADPGQRKLSIKLPKVAINFTSHLCDKLEQPRRRRRRRTAGVRRVFFACWSWFLLFCTRFSALVVPWFLLLVFFLFWNNIRQLVTRKQNKMKTVKKENPLQLNIRQRVGINCQNNNAWPTKTLSSSCQRRTLKAERTGEKANTAG